MEQNQIHIWAHWSLSLGSQPGCPRISLPHLTEPFHEAPSTAIPNLQCLKSYSQQKWNGLGHFIYTLL